MCNDADFQAAILFTSIMYLRLFEEERACWFACYLLAFMCVLLIFPVTSLSGPPSARQ